MIWLIVFLYILPVLVGLDLMKLLITIAKEEGENIYLYHVIITIVGVFMPIANLVADIFILSTIFEEYDVEGLKKHSYVVRLLFFKL